MKKTIVKILGITVKETTVYEDEEEMPVVNDVGGGEALVLTEKEITKLEERK